MRSRVPGVVVAALIAFAAAPRPAAACFCDKDSLATEAKGRPAVAPVVLGRLPTIPGSHDEQQVTRIEKLIERGVASGLDLDHLAEAYHGLDRTGQAIDLMNRKLAKFGPEAATHVRLATLHALAGNLSSARAHIDQALTLAPVDAAARIRIEAIVIAYHARLVQDPELARREDLLNLRRLTVDKPIPPRPAHRGPAEELAVMIRQGWGDNAHVWFALGRSLAHDGDNRLALRAFHRAASLGHPLASDELCETAKRFADYASGFFCPRVVNTLEREWRSARGVGRKSLRRR